MVEFQAFYAELGRRIREERDRMGLTQETLASRVSLTRTSVTNIEKGRQKLLVHTLMDIAAALEVSPGSLLPRSSAKPNQNYSSSDLDGLIKDRSPAEQDWIKAAMGTTEE